MNKKVLTVAQLRAIFKNCSLGLAVAGSALTAGKCKEGNPEEKKGKDGKSADSTTSNTDADAVKKTDLDAYAKKSDFINKLDSDAKLIIAGQTVDFSGLKGKEVTSGSLKDLLNEKGWTKNASTGVVSFTKDDVDGKTFAGVMGSSSTGVSLDSKDFKIDADGKLVAKDSSGVDAAIKDKTVSELIVDMINSKLANAVDKKDAKIVVKGVAKGEQVNGTAAPAGLYAETFTTNPTAAAGDDGLKTVELGSELKNAKAEVNANKKAAEDRMKAIENNTEEALRLLAKNATYANPGTTQAVKDEMKKSVSEGLFLGLISTVQTISNAATINAAVAKGWFGKSTLNGLYKDCIFAHWKNDGDISGVAFYKINVSNDTAANNTAFAIDSNGKWDTAGSTAIG